MNRLYRPLAITVSIAALFIIAIWLDPRAASGFTKTPLFTSASGFFSFIGNGAFLLPVCAIFFVVGAALNRLDARAAGREAFLSFILSGVVAQILKAAFERPRIPHVDGAVGKLLSSTSLFDLTGRFNSFPSGHTAAGFAVACVLAKKYPRLRVFFYAVAVLIGASRIYLGSHYPTDVLAGALAGLVAGGLITCRGEVRKKWLLSGFVLLVVCMSFFKSGGFYVFDVDEAVFSEASREMVETGDYITPTYNYEPRYDKPILFYWFMSTAFRLFGTNEFAARFTSGGFGALLVFMTFLFIKRVRGKLPAYLSSLALLLNVEFFVYSHSAVTDMTLAFFLTASFFSFYLALHENDRRWYVPFWAAAALAVLTKGAIGLLFPAAIAFLFLAASGKLDELKALFKPSYVLVFFIVAVPWFAVEGYVNGWEFFNAFVIKHHIKRYSGVISSHGGPPYFYAGILLIGFFPWVALIPGALYRGFTDFRGRLKKGMSLYLFCSIWFAFIFIFFSIARTKLPNYVFPLFPASAILAGLAFADLIEKKKEAGRRGLYVLAVISAVMAAAFFILPPLGVKMEIALPLKLFYGAGVICALIAVLGITALRSPLPSFAGISFLSAAFIVVLRLWALPPANVFLQQTLHDYSAYSRENLGPKDVLATYEINKPSIAFYAAREVKKIEHVNVCNIKEYAGRSRVLVITTPSRYNEVAELKAMDVIDQRGEYILLGKGNFPPFE